MSTYIPALNLRAEDLDLTDADDRAAFRQRVDQMFAGGRLEAMHAAIRELGGAAQPRARAAATRSIADLYISSRRGNIPRRP